METGKSLAYEGPPDRTSTDDEKKVDVDSLRNAKMFDDGNPQELLCKVCPDGGLLLGVRGEKLCVEQFFPKDIPFERKVFLDRLHEYIVVELKMIEEGANGQETDSSTRIVAPGIGGIDLGVETNPAG